MALLLVVDVDELGIDNVVFVFLLLGAGASSIPTGRSALSTTAGSPGLRFIHRLRQLMAGLRESIGSLADLFHGAAGHGVARGLHRRLHVFGVVIADLIAMLLEHFLDLVNHRVRPVARIDFVFALVVFGAVSLGVFGHLVDFLFAEAGGRRDGDLLFVVGGLVLGRDIQDAVGIDIERHFHLRDAARRWR